MKYEYYTLTLTPGVSRDADFGPWVTVVTLGKRVKGRRPLLKRTLVLVVPRMGYRWSKGGFIK